jgi:hypothetical protein
MRSYYLGIILLFPFLLQADETDIDSRKLLVRLLEITASQTNLSNRGPETIGSLLTSTRLVNSLTSNQNEFYREIKRSNESASSARIKYSHQFYELLYLGFSYTDSVRINYDRSTIGSKNSYIQDSTSTVQNRKRFNFGIGPLNYLDSFSFETSLGFESGMQKGPFSTFGFRFPRIESMELQPGNYFLGTGNLKFNYFAYSIMMGVSGLIDWFGMYLTMEIQFVNSSMVLNSVGYDTKDHSKDTGNPFSLSPNLQYAFLKFPSVIGILMNYEAGFIFKIMDDLGFKVGGYYQLAAINYNKPKGYYFSNNTLNEATSKINLSSVAERKNIGFWDISFGVVTQF